MLPQWHLMIRSSECAVRPYGRCIGLLMMFELSFRNMSRPGLQRGKIALGEKQNKAGPFQRNSVHIPVCDINKAHRNRSSLPLQCALKCEKIAKDNLL